mgnify:CR=1 FL=1
MHARFSPSHLNNCLFAVFLRSPERKDSRTCCLPQVMLKQDNGKHAHIAEDLACYNLDEIREMPHALTGHAEAGQQRARRIAEDLVHYNREEETFRHTVSQVMLRQDNGEYACIAEDDG